MRDETLPPVVLPNDVSVPSLRVTEIDVDEDLLNIGTWEERGHKRLGYQLWNTFTVSFMNIHDTSQHS